MNVRKRSRIQAPLQHAQQPYRSTVVSLHRQPTHELSWREPPTTSQPPRRIQSVSSETHEQEFEHAHEHKHEQQAQAHEEPVDVLSNFFDGIKRRKLSPQYSQEIANMLSTIAEYVSPMNMVGRNHHNHSRHPHYPHHQQQHLHDHATVQSVPRRPASHQTTSQHVNATTYPSLPFEAESSVETLLAPSLLHSATDIQELNQFFSQLYANMEMMNGCQGNAPTTQTSMHAPMQSTQEINDCKGAPRAMICSASAPTSSSYSSSSSKELNTKVPGLPVESDPIAGLEGNMVQNLRRSQSISAPGGNVYRFLNLDDACHSSGGGGARSPFSGKPASAKAKVSILLRGLKDLSLRSKEGSCRRTGMVRVSDGTSIPKGRYPPMPSLVDHEKPLQEEPQQPATTKAPVELLMSDPYSLTHRVIQSESREHHGKAPLMRTVSREKSAASVLSPPVLHSDDSQIPLADSILVTRVLPPLSARPSLQTETAPLQRSASQPVPHSHRSASVSTETRKEHLALIGTFLKRLELVWKEVEAL